MQQQYQETITHTERYVERTVYTTSRQEKQQECPQISIYNRYFYLREAHRNLLQKQYQKEIKQQSNTPKVKASSYLILSEKLEKQLNLAIMQATKEHDPERQDQINYQEMSDIIMRVNVFLSKAKNEVKLQHLLSQMWIYLNAYNIEEEWLKKEKFFVLLRLLMDPNYISPKETKAILSEVEGFHDSDQLMDKFTQEYPELKQEALKDLDLFKLWHNMRQECNGFQKQYRPLYQNSELTFKPMINQKSRIYAEKSLSRYLSSNKLQHERRLIPNLINSQNHQENELNRYLSNKSHVTHKSNVSQGGAHQNDRKLSGVKRESSYHNLLYKRKLQKSKINPRLHYENDSDQENMPKNQRKAQPAQIKQIVNHLYYVPKRVEDKDYHKSREQQEFKRCTFKPQTNGQYDSQKCKATNDTISIPVKSYCKEVERLKKGRDERQKARLAYENLGKPKYNKSTKFNKSALQKNSCPSFIQRDTPKLILEVNIGDGHIQRIKLRGDEDSALVAKKFVTKHGLDASMQSVLEDLVQDNLRNL